MLTALMFLFLGCAPTEDTFPEMFADERVRIDNLDYARFMYESDPNATCDMDTSDFDTGAFAETEDVRWDAYRDLVSPCEVFDEDAAEGCLAALRDVRTCEDALDAYQASDDGDEEDPPLGNYLFDSCVRACGVVLTYDDGSGP